MALERLCPASIAVYNAETISLNRLGNSCLKAETSEAPASSMLAME